MKTIATGVSFYLKNNANEKRIASAINSMKGILDKTFNASERSCETCGMAKEFMFAIKNTIAG